MVATQPCPTCGSLHGRTCPWCVKIGRVMIPVPIQLHNVVCVGFSKQPNLFDNVLDATVVRSLFVYAQSSWRSIACEYIVDPHCGYQCERCWISYQFIELQKVAWVNLHKRVSLPKSASFVEDHCPRSPTPNEPESVCSSPNGSVEVPFLDGSTPDKLCCSRNADFKRRISEIVSKKEVCMIKKSRQRLPPSAVTIMQEWFMDHLRRPYPNDSEKVELANRTNLSVAQVINWFTNTRKRVWLPNEANQKRRCSNPSLAPTTT